MNTSEDLECINDSMCSVGVVKSVAHSIKSDKKIIPIKMLMNLVIMLMTLVLMLMYLVIVLIDRLVPVLVILMTTVLGKML